MPVSVNRLTPVTAAVMVTVSCPIHHPPFASVLLLITAATAPRVAPGVHVTKNPRAVALVGLPQAPPVKATTEVSGMLVPVTVNCVETPACADVGEIDVITGSAAAVALVPVRVTDVVPPPPQAVSMKDKTNAAVISRKALNLGLEFLCIDIIF